MGGSYARLKELATWAEGQGLDAFARSDHYWTKTDRHTVERRLDVMRAAEADAGGEPGSVQVSFVSPTVVTATHDAYDLATVFRALRG